MTLMLVSTGVIAMIMIGILIWFCIAHKKLRLSPNNELVSLMNMNKVSPENRVMPIPADDHGSSQISNRNVLGVIDCDNNI